jgi:probable HAF family extracellular repeat protein
MGQIVGLFNEGKNTHGFLDTGGSFTQIDVPGAVGYTLIHDINNMGQIVGDFSDGTNTHGFLNTDGNFTQIDPPGGGAVLTNAFGINNAGQIVGFFERPAGCDHGFLMTPVPEAIPEPATLTLLGSGILILGSFSMMRHRKTRWHRAIEGAASRHIAG